MTKTVFSVTKNGKPLDESLYMWNEETKTFASREDALVLDFSSINYCTFDTGHYCTFDTGHYCTFDTGSNCTFKTGYNCTFDTGYNCTFDTGKNSVIVRREVFEVIQPKAGEVIKLCPCGISGYISKKEGENAFYMDINGERVEHIIADGILSKVVKKRGNVYHVINHGEEQVSYLIQDGEIYSHGATLKEAKESLKYKISDRDTTPYEGLTLESTIDLTTAIKMYRTITGACEAGCKYFVEQTLQGGKPEYSVKEVIELTKGQYNHNLLVRFFGGGDER